MIYEDSLFNSDSTKRYCNEGRGWIYLIFLYIFYFDLKLKEASEIMRGILRCDRICEGQKYIKRTYFTLDLVTLSYQVIKD